MKGEKSSKDMSKDCYTSQCDGQNANRLPLTIRSRSYGCPCCCRCGAANSLRNSVRDSLARRGGYSICRRGANESRPNYILRGCRGSQGVSKLGACYRV